MAQDHLRNIEGGLRPALALGLQAAGPAIAPIAVCCVVFLVLQGIFIDRE